MKSVCTPTPLHRQKLFVILLLLFGCNFLIAQQGIGFTFDHAVGCQTYDTDDDRKIYLENIEDGFCLRVCEERTVQYQLFGTNVTNITSTQWIVSGGQFLAGDDVNATIQWSTHGFGSLQMIITLNDGTVINKTICIEKVIRPKADFNVNTIVSPDFITVCRNQPIYFTDTSIDNGGSEIVAWSWSFGELDATSQAQNPVYSFQEYGTHWVGVTVTNSCNCTTKKVIKVEVRRPGVTITCAGVACENQTQTYSVSAADLNGCTGFTWSVDGGTIVSQSPDHLSIDVVWDNAGADGYGFVNFDATHCNIDCPEVISIRIPVIQEIGTISGDLIICEKQQGRYQLPQWPATEYTWTLDDGGTGSTLILTDQWNEVIVDAQGAGVIKLMCSYKNTLLGCTGTAEKLIKILPYVNVQGPTKVCRSSMETYEAFDAFSNPVAVNWTVEGPDGTQTGNGTTFQAMFAELGTYVISISGPNLCTPNPTLVTVFPRPSTPGQIIGTTPVCPGIPYTYEVPSPVAGFEYAWSVVGGTIQGSNIGEEVEVIFAAGQPSYSVSVRAVQQNPPHCISHPRVKSIQLINPDVSIITDDLLVCGSSYGEYASAYTAGDYYVWTIDPPTAGSVSNGDGTSSVDILWNNYTGSVTPIVKVEVFKCGISFTDEIEVTVIVAPAITLSTPDDEVCRGESFTMTLSSNPPLTEITSIVWNFGDNSQPVTVVPDILGNFPLTASHTYTTINASNVQYTVTATVYGGNGCLTPAIATFAMTQMPAPQVAVTPGIRYIACSTMDIDIEFTANVQTGIGMTTSLQWYHNDINNPILNATSEYFSPSAFGSYFVIATNNNGCWTKSNLVYVDQFCGSDPCVITPDPELGEITATVTSCTTASASISFATAPDSYQWQVSAPGQVSGSGTNTTGNFILNEPGAYIIRYKATYGECQIDRITTVIIPYKADLRYTVECNNTNGTYNVNLINHSVVYANYIIENFEFLANGTWHDLDNIEEYLATLSPGTHQVGIRITSSTFIPCEKVITITLPDFPNANFTVDTSTCPGEPIQFIPAVIDPTWTYLWTFGDNSNNSQISPQKEYVVQSESYDAFLTVTNGAGCSITGPTIQISTFGIDMAGSLSTVPENGKACEGSTVMIEFIPSQTQQTQPYIYNWMSGNTVVQTTNIAQFSPTVSGSYWLSITDANGCSLGIPEAVPVVYIKIPAPKIIGPEYLCADAAFYLEGVALVQNASYAWFLNGSQVGTGPHYYSNALPAGVYDYTLQISVPTDAGICTNMTLHTVTVLETPQPPEISINLISCDHYRFKLSASAAEDGFYTWSNGMSGQSITTSTPGPYQVTFTNLAGCSSQAQVDIPKPPSSFMWIFPEGCIKVCPEDAGYLIGPIEPVQEWSWLIDEMAVDSGSASYVSSLPVNQSGMYQLSLTNPYCQQTSEPLHVMLDECVECQFTITKKEFKVGLDEKGNCVYEFTLEILNGYPFSVPVTISTDPAFGGYFSQANLNLPASVTSIHTFLFYPPPGFTGGAVTVYFSGSLPDGRKCKSKFEFILPSCESNNSREINTAQMFAAPNPTNGATTIFYNFGNEAATSRNLHLYDLTGRLVWSRKNVDLSGAINMWLELYNPGYYILTLEADGQPVIRQRVLKQ